MLEEDERLFSCAEPQIRRNEGTNYKLKLKLQLILKQDAELNQKPAVVCLCWLQKLM